MNRRAENPWKRDDVIDYVIDSYGGTEPNANGKPRRMWLWADDDGEVWIGNNVAFAEHCAELFDFELLKYDYVALNRIMLEVGERLMPKQERGEGAGRTQEPMSPRKHRAR